MTLRRATTQERIDARNDARIEYEQDRCPHDEVEARVARYIGGGVAIERCCTECGLSLGPVEQDDEED